MSLHPNDLVYHQPKLETPQRYNRKYTDIFARNHRVEMCLEMSFIIFVTLLFHLIIVDRSWSWSYIKFSSMQGNPVQRRVTISFHNDTGRLWVFRVILLKVKGPTINFLNFNSVDRNVVIFFFSTDRIFGFFSEESNNFLNTRFSCDDGVFNLSVCSSMSLVSNDPCLRGVSKDVDLDRGLPCKFHIKMTDLRVTPRRPLNC